MKPLIIVLVLLATFTTFAKEIKDFNKTLMEKVKQDIKNDNVDEFKTKATVGRGPASVGPVQVDTPDTKLEKVKQLGHSKW